MKIGIFGGSFDPIHIGHLLLAEQCLTHANLDRVDFMPAAQPPHKPDRQLTPGDARVEMIKLAIAGHSQFRVEPCELERDGISYTVDTLESLVKSSPDDEHFLLIGADSLVEFHTWRNPQRICELATPLIVARPGSELDLKLLEPYNDDVQMKKIQEHAFKSLNVDISSSSIRHAASVGASFRFQTTRAVEQYILSKGLYQQK